MILKVENFAKIKNAEVKIDGITVIAGENNTGKSTIGKILFGIYDSFYDVNSKIEKQKQSFITNKLLKFFMRLEEENPLQNEMDFHKILKYSKDLSNNISSMDTLDKEKIYQNMLNIANFGFDIEDELFVDFFKSIKVTNDRDDEEYRNMLCLRTFKNIFDLQINHLNNKEQIASITLTIKNKPINIKFASNNIDVNGFFNLFINPVYIDNPFLMDSLNTINRIDRIDRIRFNSYISYKMIRLLLIENKNNNIFDELVNIDKINSILNKFNDISIGTFYNDENNGNELKYKPEKLNESLVIKNISTGIKSFLVIKRLLENGHLQENGLLILDEPEVHLHPEWQLIFAEILVLMQKEFNMNIVITTHSPYFLNAIEVYSMKYDISNKCNYYLAELDKEDNTISNIFDVTGATNAIYEKLTYPLQILEELEYKLRHQKKEFKYD